MDARVPKAWVPLANSDRPKSAPTDDAFAALEKLRWIFRHKMHWKIFCREGVLIGDCPGVSNYAKVYGTASDQLPATVFLYC
ncbi:hypothetical protein LIER_27632 [Lithospermum erythrorhizon]|uniref:Uncharacterized protein n=1 Tax=Lithospermum erythrorhizon TaxID=34254 RepID=A0AAV3RD13_LITER